MPSQINVGTPGVLQGVAAPGYSALDLRRLLSLEERQEGVYGSGDFKVTPSGTAKQLVVAIGQAVVQGDAVTDQGLYATRNSAAQTLELATAPDATNPRIDQVVLEIKDDAHDGSGLSVARLRVVSGTATAGATLENRTGAAALPASALRLADVLVPANFNSVFVAGTHIRDRRPWTRGVYFSEKLTNGDVNLPEASSSSIASARIECSGAPMVLFVKAKIRIVSGLITLHPFVDGALPSEYGAYQSGVGQGGGPDNYGSWRLPFTPSAGSHKLELIARQSATSAVVYKNATETLIWGVEELLRGSAKNE